MASDACCYFQIGKLEEAVVFGRTEFEKFYRLTEVDDLVKVPGIHFHYYILFDWISHCNTDSAWSKSGYLTSMEKPLSC